MKQTVVMSVSHKKSVDWYRILTTDAMNNWSTYQNSTLTVIDGLSMKYTAKSSIYWSIVILEELTSRTEPERKWWTKALQLEEERHTAQQQFPDIVAVKEKMRSFKSIPVKNGVHTNMYKTVHNLAFGFFCDVDINRHNLVSFWSHCIPICVRPGIQSIVSCAGFDWERRHVLLYQASPLFLHQKTPSKFP